MCQIAVAERGKIEAIELYHVDVPFPTPLYPVWIPGYAQPKQSYTLLRVVTRDGLEGFATSLALHRERETLGEFIGRFLIGLDPYDVDAVRERLRQASLYGWRNNWMDIAFFDLAAKRRGIPLHELLAERSAIELSSAAPSSVRAYASFLELRPPHVRAESIERAMRRGFLGAKLGVHGTESEDLDQIRMARKVAGKDFELRVHAHQAWSVSLVEEVPRWDVDRARRFLSVAAEENYRWVQEPLHDEAWSDLSDLTREAPLDVAGGDLSFTFIPMHALSRDRCYSVLTPDAAFAGLGNCVRTMRTCAGHSMGFSPSSKGDGIALAANIHMLVAWLRHKGDADAESLELTWEPPALVPELRDRLITQGFDVDAQGRVDVPTGPGLGVEIDERALTRFGERFFRLTPLRFAVAQTQRPGGTRTADSPTARRRRR